MVLYARKSFLDLLGKEFSWLEKKDFDQLNGKPPPETPGSEMISFWPEPVWKHEMLNAGAMKVTQLNPRPNSAKGFACECLARLGWEPDSNWLEKPYLGDRWKRGDRTLWIHPGSGSSSKNPPLDYFLQRAADWVKEGSNRRIVFSFGEADARILTKWSKCRLASEPYSETITPITPLSLKKSLEKKADLFLGNDSGPGHLAANLGIPVEICFLHTDPKVWSPHGPRIFCRRLGEEQFV